MIISTRDNIRIIKYIFFGILTAIIEFLIFVICKSFLALYIASIIASFISIIASFVFNRFFTFSDRGRGNVHLEASSFFVLGFINSNLSATLVVILSNVFPNNISKLISMAIITIWNYLIMNLIIFKNKKI